MRFATLVGAALLVGGCSGSSKDTAAGTGISPTDSTPPLDTDTITDTDSETPVDCDSRPLELAPPRGEVGGVWDAAKGRMVFFAGDQGLPNNCITQTDVIGDTWAFHPDCDNFEQLSVGSGPVSRARHGVAYDADGNRMIVHGGRFREGTSGTYEVLDDIWAFDLSTDTWTELPSSGGPAARHSHATWVSGGKLYVYAGNGSNDGAFYQAPGPSSSRAPPPAPASSPATPPRQTAASSTSTAARWTSSVRPSATCGPTMSRRRAGPS